MTRQEETGGGMEMLWFFAGALLGAGLALLYAPRTGREVREQVSGFTNDAMDKMKEFSSEAQEKMRTTFARGKEMVGEKAQRYASGEDPSTYH